MVNFKDLIGVYSWGWHIPHGVTLFIEFGRPQLFIREPIKSDVSSKKVFRNLSRRIVQPIGNWTLSVVGDEWAVKSKFSEINSNFINTEIAGDVFRDLSGQVLDRVDIEEGVIHFVFDLEGVLSIKRNRNKPICELFNNEKYNGYLGSFV